MSNRKSIEAESRKVFVPISFRKENCKLKIFCNLIKIVFYLLSLLSWHSVIYLSFDEVISAVKFLSALELKYKIDFQCAHLNIFQFCSTEIFSNNAFWKFSSSSAVQMANVIKFMLFSFYRSSLDSFIHVLFRWQKAVLNFQIRGLKGANSGRLL